MFGTHTISRPEISEVFTPRRNDVNNDIYVKRLHLEKALRRALEGSLHAIVFGESGSGKSWLYKKVLSELGAYVATANCANALRLRSLTSEIKQVVSLADPKSLTEQSEEMNAEVKAIFAEGGLKSTRKYHFTEQDPFLDCVRIMREDAGGHLAVLVIDNLEMIFESRELMQELASLIILLDDARYAVYKVKLLIVGVPNSAKQYLSTMHASVGNRLTEVPEVSNLSAEQVATLVKTGFVELLKVNLDERTLSHWQKSIHTVTMGYAQPVQEYCEQLAQIVEDDGWIAQSDHLERASREWLTQGLKQASGTISELMNKRETKVGRRNQVLYILSKTTKRVFHTNDIEQQVRLEFAASTKADQTLAIGQILSELSQGTNSIIKRTASEASYEFRDARLAMALRASLRKDPARGRISKIDDSLVEATYM